MKIRISHAIISLVLAFQLLSPRSWLGGVIVYFGINNIILQNMLTSLISFPLAFLIGYYLAPSIARLKDDIKIMFLVALVPFCYYISTYVFSIYSLITIEDTQLLLKFANGWFVLAFLAYTTVSIYIFEEKNNLDMEKNVLLRMQNQTKTELEQLHKQYELDQIHRHDLRHHGNYILNLLPPNTNPDITDYINSVFLSQESTTFSYSNDKNLNLLLNFYRKKAIDMNTDFSIHIGVEDYSNFTMIDLCSLLSNGIENALNATSDLSEAQRKITLIIRTADQTLCIDLRNSFSKQPIFVDGMPISLDDKHGYGTRSMLKICQKYNGISNFSVSDNEFRFQAVLSNHREL